LKMEIRYNTSENHKNTAVAIQEQLKPLGVEVTLLNTDTKTHYGFLEQKGNYDVARAAWIADYNDAQTFLGLLETRAGPQNYGRYSSPKFDDLMNKASLTADLSARGKLMADAEAVAMEDQPIIPIYYYVSKDLVSTKVAGWVDNVFNIHRTRFMSIQN